MFSLKGEDVVFLLQQRANVPIQKKMNFFFERTTVAGYTRRYYYLPRILKTTADYHDCMTEEFLEELLRPKSL